MPTRKPSVSHYPGGTRLSDWWSGSPHWPSPLLGCARTAECPHHPPTSKKPSTTPRRPEYLSGRNAGTYCAPFPWLWPWHLTAWGCSTTFVQKGTPPQHSMLSSPEAPTSRLHILKNRLALHFTSSIISKSTYWVYLWELSTQLGLGVEM